MSRVCGFARRGSLAAALMVWIVAGGSLQAQERSVQDQKSSSEKSQASKQQLPISKARRNELMNFVHDNHPELKPLINSLRKKRPVQYNAAMRSLNKAVTRLNQLEIRQSEQRYNQALRDWRLQSRIQLLSAQLSIKDTPARRKQLEKLITRRIDNRISQLNAEIEKTQKRLDRLTGLVTETEVNRTADIHRQFQAAIRSAERIKLSRQKKKKQEDDP